MNKNTNIDGDIVDQVSKIEYRSPDHDIVVLASNQIEAAELIQKELKKRRSEAKQTKTE